MPWRSTSPAEEQVRFIQRWQEGGVSFVDLCRQFGISPKTGYKRVRRFQDWGWDGLGDWSRAPHCHPNATDGVVAEQVIAAKRAHLTWGPKKLVAWLEARDPAVRWPAPSTAGDLLRRAGLVQRRKGRRRSAPWSHPFARAEEPNDVWSIDWKGWFRTGDGQRCDPLTVVDGHSRFLLVCQALTPAHGPEVRRVLERTFRTYGLPQVIRSDNGPPFASTGLGGLSRLSVWWVKLGILPERIAPGHPEQNGRLERLHRTLKQETACPPRPTLHAQQRAFTAFQHHYNEERPHEALRQHPPATVYRPSPRPYPPSREGLREPEYGSDIVVRRVRTNGQIKWRGGLLYLSEALKGELVGLLQQDERYWTIQYGPLQIGLMDDHARKFYRVPVKVLPMSPV